jgi:putative ABC transport system ATP-binding protein
MFSFLKRKPKTARAGAFAHGNENLIELRNVVKEFKTGAGIFQALRGVNLNVHTHEFLAIIGKSGSGKSTMINMITGIDRPTAGAVLVGDTAVHTLGEGKMAEWRGRNLGVIFQFFQLLPTLTLLENVMLPMDFCNLYSQRERRERGLNLLEMVGMSDNAHKMPSACSGGQQQRAAIARALANDPPILVADEPTGNLDSKTANAVFDLFSKLVSEGKTVLMVTHDSDFAKRVTRAVMVADGEIVDEIVNQRIATADQAGHDASSSQAQAQPTPASAQPMTNGRVDGGKVALQK